MRREPPGGHSRSSSASGSPVGLFHEVIEVEYPLLQGRRASKCTAEGGERQGVRHQDCGCGSTPTQNDPLLGYGSQWEQRRRHGQGRSYPRAGCKL